MKKLRAIRAGRLLSQRGLAALAGVSDTTVNNIEGGDTTPRPIVIEKLSAALGVEPGEVEEFSRAISKAAGGPNPASATTIRSSGIEIPIGRKF